MGHVISVLIADDNVEFGKVLRDYLAGSGGLTVTGTARDGVEAIRMTREQEPDVIILDLIMPNLDGIAVLERIADLELKRKPIIIVLTAIGQDNFIQKAIRLGAEYYMVKPFDADMLVKRIKQLYFEKYDRRESTKAGNTGTALFSGSMPNRLEKVVTDLIKSMGIIPNIAGFHYLREAVILSVENPDMLDSATRNIYPVIAGRHNTTTDRVNRAIRSAIENSSGMEEGTADSAGKEGRESANTRIIACLARKAKQMLNGKVR